PYLLMASAVALVATAAFHTWWARRHGHAPPSDEADAVPVGAGAAGGTGTAAGEAESTGGIVGAGETGTTLWRMRTTVLDAPGSLAALCTALAGLRVDILTLQTHPLAQGTVDEFLLRAPASLQAQELSRKIAAAG
ncbi:GNAT family N-acetyltransferase, partial [Streptomyces sp. SID7982]|nr:GNAT family N-acetyltransferase [Streptomyces sp. SID7982]